METETRMTNMAHLDDYGRYLLNCKEAMELLLQGKDITGSFFLDDEDILLYNEHVAQVLNDSKLSIYEDLGISCEEFHTQRKNEWFIPAEYAGFDVHRHLLSLCKNSIETGRVNSEYALFEKYDLVVLLRFMKYFMDIVSEKGLVVGVGRGSSVSLYCLYLLGIHKIDSIKYELEYTDFFKQGD